MKINMKTVDINDKNKTILAVFCNMQMKDGVFLVYEKTNDTYKQIYEKRGPVIGVQTYWDVNLVFIMRLGSGTGYWIDQHYVLHFTENGCKEVFIKCTPKFINYSSAPEGQSVFATQTRQPIKDAAREMMLDMLRMYKDTWFHYIASYGDEKIYRNALDATKLVYDPKLSSVAVFNPANNTITFSFDPAAVIKTATNEDKIAFGEKIYHEVTHKIEDIHNDTGYWQNKKYKERNIEYMNYIYQVAFPKLKMLEDAAKTGASDAKLQQIWNSYLRALKDVKNLPETTAYPPDFTLLKSWFGVEVDPETIKYFYIGLGQPKRLKEFFSQRSWTGTWESFALGKVILKQAGSDVKGTYENKDEKGIIEGRADGTSFVGNLRLTYYALFPNLSEAELKAKYPESFGTIEVLMSEDGTRYDGEIKDPSGKHLYTEMGNRMKI